MNTIALCLPWPPTTNNAYSNNPRGGRTLNREGKDYKASVQAAVVEARFPRIEGRLSVWLELFPPNQVRRDVANFEKLVIDGLVEAKVFDDDCQIDELRITRRGVVDEGEVHVWIKPMETN